MRIRNRLVAAIVLSLSLQVVELFLPLAQAGHMEAQFNPGSIYFAGTRLARDLDQADTWLRAALRQGDGRI